MSFKNTCFRLNSAFKLMLLHIKWRGPLCDRTQLKKREKNEKINRWTKPRGMNPCPISERRSYHSIKDEYHAGNTKRDSEEFWPLQNVELHTASPMPVVDKDSCQFMTEVTHYLDCFHKAALAGGL